MEMATLTSTTLKFSSRSRSRGRSRKSLCARRKRAIIHLEHTEKRNAPVSGHFIQAHSQIGLGCFCIQSRIRGSAAKPASPLSLGFACKSNSRKPHAFLLGTVNKCNAPLMPLERRRRSNPRLLGYEQFAGFSVPPVAVACSSAPFCAEGGGDFSTSKRLFCTHITRPYKWPSRSVSAACRGRSGDLTSDEFGPYPWDPLWNASDNEAIEWIQEDIVTLFTTDGLIQIGGSLIPHQISAMERKQSRGKAPVRYRRFREEDYMDPKQGLCLGASFDIVATNGLDKGRRFCVFGFCRSIEMLSDVIEDTVLEQGGEVVVAAKGNWGGLNEKLSMRVAVPLLWGVPPAVDTLNYAIRCGGGIVEKVSCQWEFL